jgi:hypothetical protein
MKINNKDLFRSIGDIDDRFVSEVLEEGLESSVVKMDKKSSSGKILKFAKVYLPAAAGLLIAVVCIKTFVQFGSSQSANTASSGDSAAPMASYSSEAAAECAEEEMDSVMSENSAEMAATESLDISGEKENAEAAVAGAGEEPREPSIGMPNPFIECKDLDEAARIAGFELAFPAWITEKQTMYVNAIEGSLIQIIVYDENGEEVYRVRKGGLENISGDYNTYDYCESFEGDGYVGEIRGGSVDAISCAEWSDQEFNYSITTGDEPMTAGHMMEMIEAFMAENGK